jgi:hypothetical protein
MVPLNHIRNNDCSGPSRSNSVSVAASLNTKQNVPHLTAEYWNLYCRCNDFSNL